MPEGCIKAELELNVKEMHTYEGNTVIIKLTPHIPVVIAVGTNPRAYMSLYCAYMIAKQKNWVTLSRGSV